MYWKQFVCLFFFGSGIGEREIEEFLFQFLLYFVLG